MNADEKQRSYLLICVYLWLEIVFPISQIGFVFQNWLRSATLASFRNWLTPRSAPNFGDLELPTTLIFRKVPAPFLAKNGSTGLSSQRFHPVMVWETLACNFSAPW